jgi:UDP-glucuronate 4-epimerase
MVIGLDSMSDYYDVTLKKNRYNELKKNKNFTGFVGFIQDRNLLNDIMDKYKPYVIFHLAAQAGVRFSIENPKSYVESNLIGTFEILELARNYKPKHLLMASTSSVYGANLVMPFDENQKCDTQMSFYAATKKSNEVMAHSYSHIFDIPITVFRFFTVYGTWGRPDMALFKFTKNILEGLPIEVYNNGKMKRDFTNVLDLVEAIKLLIPVSPKLPNSRKEKFLNDSISDVAPFRVVNIGNSNAIDLLSFISELENALGTKAKKIFLALQPGDVPETFSDINLLKNLTGFSPKISYQEGIKEFVDWYRGYYK